jgi:hypothetical protein
LATPLPFAPEFLVNTTTSGYQSDPAVAALADGRFVVTWEDTRLAAGDNSGLAIRAQIFNADESKAGGEFTANTTTNSNQTNPSIAGTASGGFVIT